MCRIFICSLFWNNNDFYTASSFHYFPLTFEGKSNNCLIYKLVGRYYVLLGEDLELRSKQKSQ